MAAVPPETINDLVVALVSGAPALTVAIGAYFFHRRDCRAALKGAQEENAKLMEIVRLALSGQPGRTP